MYCFLITIWVSVFSLFCFVLDLKYILHAVYPILHAVYKKIDKILRIQLSEFLHVQPLYQLIY